MLNPHTQEHTVNLALLQHVLDVSKKMAETRQLLPLLEYAIREAVKLVGALRGYLVLRQADDTWHIAVRAVPDGDRETGDDPISRSILDRVLHSGEPILLKNALEDDGYKDARSILMHRLRSVMCVPLISHGECIGAIFVENNAVKARFTSESLPPLLLFANQAATAIENALLNDELENRVAQRTRELEQAKGQLEHSWQEAIEANHIRTVALSNIAHDLRSPLSIVIGALSMLSDGVFGEMSADQVEWVVKATEAASQSLRLTNDVFDLVKLELGGLRLNREMVELNTYLPRVYNIGKALPWEQDLIFNVELEAELPRVCIDPGRIQQVLLNLISNAIKATPRGNITLYSYHDPEHNMVVVGVKDTGKGISPDDQDRLFERFYQVSKDQKKRHGTGLGLAICRDLVAMHGGQIWVESAADQGADFKFTLPVVTEDCAK